MVSLRRLFGLILLFLFFEVVVALLASLAEMNVLLACAAMTGLALAVWVIYVAVTRFLLRPRENAAPSPAADTPTPAPVQETKRAGNPKEDAELIALMREANDRLAAAPVNADRKVKWTVGTMPLYLVVGLEGAGKTSIMANSGTDAKLLAGESYRDTSVVPTRLCNFWLAHGAVFADVSGRMFSGEPERWESILQTLGRSHAAPLLARLWLGGRRVNNLRGVILVADAHSFVGGPDQEKLAALSRKIQERLHTIGSAFETGFPVYVLLSNSDAIPYFGEFFGHLSDTEDQRILGATLPSEAGVGQGGAYSEAATRRLTSYFNRLYGSLADKRLLVLAREDVPGKRPFVYEFPREVKRIRGDVVRFLVDLFRPNPLQPSPKLRGFYFSGTRRVTSGAILSEKPDEFSVIRSKAEATVFFRGGSSSAAGGTQIIRPAASSEPAVTRWAFLAELFQSVILKDQAAPGSIGASRFDWYRSAVFAAITLLGLILAIAFAVSGARNRGLLRDVSTTVNFVAHSESAPASPAGFRDLEALRLQLIPLLRNQREGPSLGWRWGLYSGNRVLPALRDLYFARFRKSILDPALNAMSTRFVQLNPAAPTAGYGEIYDLLKTYRTVTAGECKPDQALLDRVLPDAWPGAAAADPETLVLANRQIQFYVSELLVQNPYRDQISENAPARKQAQDYLINQKGPDKLLRGLLEEVNRTQVGADLAKYAPNYQAVITGPGHMDGSFTRAGWDVIEKRIKDGKFGSPGEACVAGRTAEVGSILQAGTTEREIVDLYVRQYIKRWKDFIESEGVVNFGRADAADKLRTLAENNRSPLLALIFMISENTNFSAPAASTLQSTIAEQAKSRFSFLDRGKKAAQIAQQAAGAQSNHPLSVPADIGKAFQPVLFTVSPSDSEKKLNDANRPYIASLGDLADALQFLAKTPIDGSQYDQARKAIEVGFANARKLEGGFNSTPDGIDIDMNNLVEAPLRRARAILGDPGQEANAGAAALCAKYASLLKKYPFNPNATEQAEVSIDELKRFFAPSTGELAQFTKRPPFDKLLTKSGAAWAQAAGTQPALAPQFLEAFNALMQFSDALFPGGSSDPKLDYTIMVMSPSKIQAMKVTVDGHSTPIDNVRERFNWPSTRGQSSARVDITVSGASIPLVPPYGGPWAVFRMLQNADSSSGNTYVFSKIRQGTWDRGGSPEPVLDSDGKPIEVDVQVESQGVNVFAKDYFSRLKCVPRAVQ